VGHSLPHWLLNTLRHDFAQRHCARAGSYAPTDHQRIVLAALLGCAGYPMIIACDSRAKSMICSFCHGNSTFPPCPECGGCGFLHCCEGDRACGLDLPSVSRRVDRTGRDDDPGLIESVVAHAGT
jgi:hypothetical protein